MLGLKLLFCCLDCYETLHGEDLIRVELQIQLFISLVCANLFDMKKMAKTGRVSKPQQAPVYYMRRERSYRISPVRMAKTARRASSAFWIFRESLLG